MDGLGSRGADPQHGSHRVAARAQVRDFPQVLHGMILRGAAPTRVTRGSARAWERGRAGAQAHLLLQRVFRRIARAHDLDFRRPHLPRALVPPRAPGGLHHGAVHADRAAHGHALRHRVRHHLHRGRGGPIAHVHERHPLVPAHAAHPALDEDRVACSGALHRLAQQRRKRRPRGPPGADRPPERKCPRRGGRAGPGERQHGALPVGEDGARHALPFPSRLPPSASRCLGAVARDCLRLCRHHPGLAGLGASPALGKGEGRVRHLLRVGCLNGGVDAGGEVRIVRLVRQAARVSQKVGR